MIPTLSFTCSNPQHEDEQASYFCRKQKCIQNNPICVLCAFSTHKQHEVMPFKMVLKRIEEDSKAHLQNLPEFAQIDMMKQKLYGLCKKVPDLQTRETIKSSIGHYLSLLMQKIQLDEVQKLKQQIDKVKLQQEQKEKKQIIPKIISYFKKISQSDLQAQDKVDKSNYGKLLKDILQNLQDSLHAFEEMIKKQQINSSAIEIFTPGAKKFHFSPEIKHSNLILASDSIIKMADEYAATNYIALCEPKLSFSKIQIITFKIVVLTSYITIGICKKNKIPDTYQFNSAQSNHGTFQISFDGYSWCDGNSTVNEQYSGWYFNQGDKVTIQFNPKARKLKFFKNGNEQQNYEMPIEFNKNEKLYFCVALNSKPQQVHIVD